MSTLISEDAEVRAAVTEATPPWCSEGPDALLQALDEVAIPNARGPVLILRGGVNWSGTRILDTIASASSARHVTRTRITAQADWLSTPLDTLMLLDDPTAEQVARTAIERPGGFVITDPYAHLKSLSASRDPAEGTRLRVIHLWDGGGPF